VKYLIENYRDDFNELKVVSDVLSTNQKYAVALEAALGYALNYVVVESIAEARKPVNILKENNKGRATFIPLDQLANSYEVFTGALAEHVKSTRKYKELKELLLGKTNFVNSLDETDGNVANGRVAGSNNGAVITGDSFLKSGSKDKNAGMRVGLQDKIERLKKKAKKTASKIEKCESDLNITQQKLKEIKVDRFQAAFKEFQN